MEERTPTWGIEPVPERLRVLGFLDTAALWGSLGVSLLVLVAGTFLVPALSLRDALIAIVVGGIVGNVMLGTAGAIGAQARVPAMVLMRPSLGRRGSYAATGLNVAQNLGWATFELIVIGTAAAALSDEVFGFEGKWLWTILFGLLTAVMALAGPIAVVRRFVRRFALWVVLASLVYLTWWTIDNADLDAAWARPGDGESLWYGIDLMIALPASWLPLIADYTRFSRGRRSAFAGSAVGYLIPNAWLYALGALLVTTSSAYSDPTELMTSIAAGGLAAGLALLALTVDETDERVLDGRLAPEHPAAGLPACAHRACRDRRHGGRSRHHVGGVRDVPLHARVLLRAAFRGAARGLAARRRALHACGRVRGAGVSAAADRRVAGGLLPLPVAPSDGPERLDRPRR